MLNHPLLLKYKDPLFLGHCIAMCFPSIAPIQCGRCQTDSKSLEMFFQSVADFEGLTYLSFNAFQMALSVSWIMWLTVVLPILYEKLILCWSSPLAKYRRVKVSLSAALMACLIFVLTLVTKGPTKLSKCSNRSGVVHMYLKRKEFTVTIFSKYMQL